ncbi:MAG: phospholipase D family protein [Cyclobacteriaceae bacterium]
MVKNLLLPALLFLIACNAEREFPEITADFCSQIPVWTPPTLTRQLDSLSSQLQTHTGVQVLEEGDEAMISRAWLCAAAERTIDIQYFIFSSDNVGLIASEYLLEAANRGVQVRVIVDDIMVEADADELLALDAHPNLAIRIYNPTANTGKNLPKKLLSMAKGFRDFNQRMHNKTFIVDGRVVITGGRNIADEYFDYDHEYNFRDRDVLLLGKAVGTVQQSFEEFWGSPLSVGVSELLDTAEVKLNTAVKYEYLRQYACNPDNFWPDVRRRIEGMPETFRNAMQTGALHWVDSLTFVSDAPGKNDGSEGLGGGGQSTQQLVELIRGAKQSIYIQSPYLIGTATTQQLFADAVIRGVKIHVLTNSLASTDNLEAFSGYQRERDALLATGASIYEYRPDAAVRRKLMTGSLQKRINFAPVFGLHAKTMVIDDAVAVIGTFNLDPRSANLNTECLAIVHDERIAREVRTAIEEDMKPENAWQTTTAFNPDGEAGWWKRVKTWTRRLVPESIL